MKCRVADAFIRVAQRSRRHDRSGSIKPDLSNRSAQLEDVMPQPIAGRKMRLPMAAILLAFGICGPAWAQLSVSIGLPSARIGINVPVYPHLIPVPGYPVYYDPRLDSNLFFYDGLYWVYAQDNWYTSSWYDGPWDLVEPEMVPDFVLRIPVRYYRRPPPYFLGWDREAPPRWGEHWGRDWDDRRRGWEHWDRASIPERAPRPTYQRKYSRDHYPRADQRQILRERNYHYQPREEVVRRHFEQPPGHVGQGPARTHTDRQQPKVPPPDIRRGNTPGAADHPPAEERRRVPPPPPRRDAVDAHRSQSDRRAPQQGNPGVQPQQRRPEQDSSAPDSQPSRPRTDKPPG
jgi:hypothetical protein